jgi:hypothetical protein
MRETLTMNRRGFLTGIGALIAAPAIVRYGSLMPVRGIIQSVSLRPLSVYNVGADQDITRLDVLYGPVFVYPFLHVRPEWIVIG